MVATELQKELIEAGAALVRRLDENELQPDAAFWFYYSDAQVWKLVLAEAKVASQGPKEVYRRIQRLLWDETECFAQLSLNDVSLITPDAPVVTLLRFALSATPTGVRGIRFSKNVINGTMIEDAYIYRLSKPKSWSDN